MNTRKAAMRIVSICLRVAMLVLIVLGIIGEYIGKIHMEVKKRPLYIAEYKDNER